MNTNEIIKKLFFIDGDFKAVKLREHYLEKNDLIFIPETGFYKWNGQYWEHKKENDIAQELDKILDSETRNSRIKEVIGLLEKKQNRSIDCLNKNRNRLVLKNGTLDLTNWESPIFYENKYFKEDYCTIQLNVNYNPHTISPTWHKYLDTTFDNDKERIDLVGELLGYCLQPKCNLEKAFILYGTGGNGKSVLLNVIDMIFTTENVSEVSMSDLDKAFSRSAIYNKLVNKSSELDTKVLDTSYFKKLVSGEYVDAQFKFKDVFKFRNMAKMIFSMNTLPMVKDRTDGFYRRLIIIPFLNKFEGKNKDINLSYKLEQELDGIFIFALAGLKRLAKNKEFTYSKEVDKLFKEFQVENNPVLQFAEENIFYNKTSDFYISSNELYSIYEQWAISNGYRPLNARNFGREISNIYGNVKARRRIEGKRIYVYEGLSLLDDINEKIISIYR